MSKYLMLLLATTALSLSACGKDSSKNKGTPNNARGLDKGSFPNVPQSPMGQWRAPDEVDNGVFFKTNFYVNQNSVGVEIVCSRGPDAVTIGLAVRGRVNEAARTIEVLETGTAKAKNGNLECTASLNPMKFNYFVTNNSMQLSVDNKGRMDLVRIQ